MLHYLGGQTAKSCGKIAETCQKSRVLLRKICSEEFQVVMPVCTCFAAPLAKKDTFVDWNLDLGALLWVTNTKIPKFKYKKNNTKYAAP